MIVVLEDEDDPLHKDPDRLASLLMITPVVVLLFKLSIKILVTKNAYDGMNDVKLPLVDDMCSCPCCCDVEG